MESIREKGKEEGGGRGYGGELAEGADGEGGRGGREGERGRVGVEKSSLCSKSMEPVAKVKAFS